MYSNRFTSYLPQATSDPGRIYRSLAITGEINAQARSLRAEIAELNRLTNTNLEMLKKLEAQLNQGNPLRKRSVGNRTASTGESFQHGLRSCRSVGNIATNTASH